MTVTRALIRIVSMVIWTLFLLPFAVLTWVLSLERMRDRIIRAWFAGVVRIIGFHVRQSGTMPGEGGGLVVSNHCSYVDIPVLGSLTEIRFTPKRDVGRWPVIGFLTRMSGAIFIARESRQDLLRETEVIRSALRRGIRVAIFPEGTTSDGERVLPFKSSLFAVACPEQGAPEATRVYPVTLAYTRIDGRAMNSNERSNIAWYGEMTLLPHLWKMLQLTSVTVEVQWHEAILITSDMARKLLADQCRSRIALALEQRLGQAESYVSISDDQGKLIADMAVQSAYYVRLY